LNVCVLNQNIALEAYCRWLLNIQHQKLQ